MLANDEHGSINMDKAADIGRWALMLVVGALVAYFTSQVATERRFGTLEGRLDSLRVERERDFAEIQRSLSRIEKELERLRQ